MISKKQELRELFEKFANEVADVVGPNNREEVGTGNRELAIVRTKLQEAFFWALEAYEVRQ